VINSDQSAVITPKVVARERALHVRADDLELWPLSGLWVIGLFVGIDLLLYSWWLVSLRMGKFEARNLS
jgi:hypothetical protein